jgi:hypothetical protein
MLKLRLCAATVTLATALATLVASGAPASATTHVSPFEIVSNYGNHLCLSAEDDSRDTPYNPGDPVYLYKCFNGAMQQWNWITGDQLTNAMSGLCLDAENVYPYSPGSDGDPLQLWTCNGKDNQKWSAEAASSSSCVWANLWNQDVHQGPAMFLDAENDIYGNPNQNYDKVQLWTEDNPSNDASNQEWSCAYQVA